MHVLDGLLAPAVASAIQLRVVPLDVRLQVLWYRIDRRSVEVWYHTVEGCSIYSSTYNVCTYSMVRYRNISWTALRRTLLMLNMTTHDASIGDINDFLYQVMGFGATRVRSTSCRIRPLKRRF